MYCVLFAIVEIAKAGHVDIQVRMGWSVKKKERARLSFMDNNLTPKRSSRLTRPKTETRFKKSFARFVGVAEN